MKPSRVLSGTVAWRTLGAGTYGTVTEARLKSGEKVAVKWIRLNRESLKYYRLQYQEARKQIDLHALAELDDNNIDDTLDDSNEHVTDVFQEDVIAIVVGRLSLQATGNKGPLRTAPGFLEGLGAFVVRMARPSLSLSRFAAQDEDLSDFEMGTTPPRRVVDPYQRDFMDISPVRKKSNHYQEKNSEKSDRSTMPVPLELQTTLYIPGNQQNAFTMAYVQELGTQTTITATRLRDRQWENKTSEMACHLFELLWSHWAMVSHGGVIYHGDIKSENIMFTLRPDAMQGNKRTGIGFGLRDVNQPDSEAMPRRYWQHGVPPRDIPTRLVFLDFGFTAYLQLQLDEDNRKNISGKVLNTKNWNISTFPSSELMFSNLPEEVENAPISNVYRDWRSDLWQLGIVAFTMLAQFPMFVKNASREAMDDTFLSVKGYAEMFRLPAILVDILAYIHNDPEIEYADMNIGNLFVDSSASILQQASFGNILNSFDIEPVHAFYQQNIHEKFMDVVNAIPGVAASIRAYEATTGTKHTLDSFVDMALFQECIGNGWRPGTLIPEFKNNLFYKILYEFRVEQFMVGVVLNRRMPLYRFMKEMVDSLSPDAQALIRSMMAWDRARRPSHLDCLRMPFFKQHMRYWCAPTKPGEIRNPADEPSHQLPEENMVYQMMNLPPMSRERVTFNCETNTDRVQVFTTISYGQHVASAQNIVVAHSSVKGYDGVESELTRIVKKK